MDTKLLCSMVVLACLASGAHAQIHGLPVGTTAAGGERGSMSAGLSAELSEDTQIHGVRVSYRPLDSLDAFLGLGLIDSQHEAAKMAAQAGLTWALPVDLPVDIGLRATTIPYIEGAEYYLEGTLSVLASMPCPRHEGWSVYASAGVVYQDWELEFSLSPDLAAATGMSTYVDKDQKTDNLFSVGVVFETSDNVSVFAEAAYLKTLFGGFGVRVEL